MSNDAALTMNSTNSPALQASDEILKIDEAQGRGMRDALIDLLSNCVEEGASIGFTWPLSKADAGAYWDDVLRDITRQSRILLVSMRAGELTGSVQLGLCTRLNGLHRAEVQKLMVHTRWRRRGLGKHLMTAIEREAMACNRTLLYLDTEPGKPAVELYKGMNWVQAGEIPDYACSPDGHLHGTAIFYKRLSAAGV